MFAMVVLTTRYRRPFAVWAGAVTAFSGHVVLAVTIGSFLQRLPEQPVEVGVGVLFLVGAVLLWRDEGETHDAGDGAAPRERRSAGRVALHSAAVLGIA